MQPKDTERQAIMDRLVENGRGEVVRQIIAEEYFSKQDAAYEIEKDITNDALRALADLLFKVKNDEVPRVCNNKYGGVNCSWEEKGTSYIYAKFDECGEMTYYTRNNLEGRLKKAENPSEQELVAQIEDRRIISGGAEHQQRERLVGSHGQRVDRHQNHQGGGLGL
ncbi:MAG: hypothetical protein OXU53_11570 [Deltaproteobacteria bacterium]|nr:hypothetical protein [Deltaproteobacteria bacterium]